MAQSAQPPWQGAAGTPLQEAATHHRLSSPLPPPPGDSCVRGPHSFALPSPLGPAGQPAAAHQLSPFGNGGAQAAALAATLQSAKKQRVRLACCVVVGAALA